MVCIHTHIYAIYTTHIDAIYAYMYLYAINWIFTHTYINVTIIIIKEEMMNFGEGYGSHCRRRNIYGNNNKIINLGWEGME